MIGEVLLSRYKITQVLGGGGFSDTYLARDLALPGEPYCVVTAKRAQAWNIKGGPGAIRT